MRIHDLFAANLRQICAKFELISEVARRIGINRQQFNRYLSGENIPNKTTIARMAKFLGIDEFELFKFKNDSNITNAVHIDSAALAASTEMALAGGAQTVLPPGYYCCYFPLQGTSQFLVKSIIKVVRRGASCYFARRTVFKSMTSPKVTLAEGKHRGVVLASESDIYLLGINGVDPTHLSLFVIERQQVVGSPVLSGLAITKGTSTHFASRVCLRPIGPSLKAAKHHFGSLGIVSVNSLELDPTIILMMTTEQGTELKPSQLALPYFEELMISSRTGSQTQLKAIA